MSETAIRLYGFTLRFQAKGAEQWERYLLELSNRARNLQPVFERYGEYMVSGSIQRNFEAEGRPGRWAALSSLYGERKAKMWPGKGILEASGAMRSGFVFRATPQTLKIWNAARWWWIVHQKGSSNLFGRGIRLPARVMLLLQDADKSVLTRWAREYLRMGELS